MPSELSAQNVLLPRAEGGSAGLIQGLRQRGATVDEVILYRSAPPSSVNEEVVRAIRNGGIDVATFASSSSVRNLAALLGGDFDRLRDRVVACIGPVTATTARELGLPVQVEPSIHTVPALVEALKAYFGTKA
jgi:uroporphyrinogen III methyltransferase/synthase